MDLGEATFARKVDILFLSLAKHYRYPLPTPAHLRGAEAQAETDTAAAASAATAVATSSSSGGGGNNGGPDDGRGRDETPEALAVRQSLIREAARRCCEERVPGLREWRADMTDALALAERCDDLVSRTQANLRSLRTVTQLVQEQSESLNSTASAMLTRKAKLELIQAELQRTIAHFTHMEDLCHEAEGTMLSATSNRFPVLFQELQNEMRFLCANSNFKSARVYAIKLAGAQRRVAKCLENALAASFRTVSQEVATSAVYASASQLDPTRDETLPALAPLPPPTAASPPDSPSARQQQENTASSSVEATPLVDKSMSVFSVGSDPFTYAAITAGLRHVNELFVERHGRYAALRRMAEVRGGLAYTGAEAFGEDCPTTPDDDEFVKRILDAYRGSRIELVTPLFRRWLTALCSAGGGGAGARSQLVSPARSFAGTPASHRTTATSTAAAAAAAVSDSLGATPLTTAPPAPASSPSPGKESSATPGPLTAIGAAASSLSQLATHLCALLELCLVAERTVTEQMWVRDEVVDGVGPLLDADLTTEAFHIFRSRLVRVDDIAELSRTIQVVQAANLRLQSQSLTQEQEGTSALTRLFTSMTQDTQERMIFRTSVFLKTEVAAAKPTAADVAALADPDALRQQCALSCFPYLPGVQRAVSMLRYLYPTLEFSVFSVFAEEAIQASLALIQELGRAMSALKDPDAQEKALLCQLAHLLFLRRELGKIDANITVVERTLDLAALRRRRLEIVQSSRDSKKTVESETAVCADRLVQALAARAVQPMAGAARMSDAQVAQALDAMARAEVHLRDLVAAYTTEEAPSTAAAAGGGGTQAALTETMRQRVEELRREAAELQSRRTSAEPSPAKPAVTSGGAEAQAAGQTATAVAPPSPSSSSAAALSPEHAAHTAAPTTAAETPASPPAPTSADATPEAATPSAPAFSYPGYYAPLAAQEIPQDTSAIPAMPFNTTAAYAQTQQPAPTPGPAPQQVPQQFYAPYTPQQDTSDIL